LNFANAYNPGGGYIHGALAQEEELCRASPYLYASLNDRKNSFYPFEWDSQLLYTENVEFIRNDYNKLYTELLPYEHQYTFLNKPYKCNIITAAAPNLSDNDFSYIDTKDGYINMLNKLFKQKMEDLIENVYFTPFSNKPNVLILGALGCGAFRPQNNLNPKFEHVYPEFIAECFKNVLNRVGKIYDKVCFAIPDKEGVNYMAFHKVFSS
jgi:uncharacterized protein (TIGR02452 family)